MDLIGRCLLVVFLNGLLTTPVCAQPGLHYTGHKKWDAATGTLTFLTTGTMPDAKEDFFWVVPAVVKRIVVGVGVTVTGGFRISYREPNNPLAIEGADRKTSVIWGTDTPEWTGRNGVPDNEKWKYGAVSVLADAVVHVRNLTAKNPRGYIIAGYANRSVIHLSQCDLLDTRPGNNNNSDGFIGAAGSSIRDTFISTSDDAIKVYNDITIENVTIEQHRNGAALQLGWGGETGTVAAHIRNLSIRGIDPDKRYNMAPITWEQGTTGSRTLLVDGLFVQMEGEMYAEREDQWVAAGLFELKPRGCIFTMRADNVDIRTSDYGLRTTPGVVTICGTQEQRTRYLCNQRNLCAKWFIR